MTFKTGKQKFTKEEIIDILKRNVSLFRDEEEFVQYIVDLAMYLVEHRLQTVYRISEPKPPKPSELRFRSKNARSRSSERRQRDEELYNVSPQAFDTCRMWAGTAGCAALRRRED